ncbi:hypothetical protein Egran_02446 [Elaphomyces granulatus]|uniref:Uncharacterized protein n=1 Tax=Elaphomyces granulatus TaxID=519963 RepID=A0A232M057_9EURO|nr:hypothetical protein Egran_02446 [Elaphomyces granulatus]
MFPRFSAITLLLGVILMWAIPTISLSAPGEMVQDDFGLFKIEPNGTVFSLDRNETVIDSKQLTPEEFKTLTGCNMAMQPSADLETEQCMQNKPTIPNSDVSMKRDKEVFKRELTCALFFCRDSFECTRLTTVTCKGCLRSGTGIQVCAFW